ncbi:hypothetical protein O3P69_003505 [Scylla paramamosain]|uniref:Uncharacterized protein n=1 Tax=Scylla paramamosain TaxID=85552 RepID=A0AAW0UIE5_SCYPA
MHGLLVISEGCHCQLNAMSDSSNSDGEESKFKEVCDPTLWRTAAERYVVDTNSPKQAANPQHCSESSERQSFVLLEKIKASLAASRTKNDSPWRGCDGSGSHRKGSRTVDVSRGTVAAPSTLSPYLAKQLTARLDGSVEFYSSQEDPSPVNQDCGSTNQQNFHLLKNVSLIHQESETHSDTQKKKRKRVKVPKRLAYIVSSDEEDLKTKCSSVAVSPEWIQAGGESCPRPHPKNVRYLDEYRVKEHRSDGSIIAVLCSALDSTDTAKSGGKNKKKKAKESVSKNENDSVCIKEKVHDISQNGVDNLNSQMKTQRKQTRKRGKKKKKKEDSEISTL